MENLYLILSLAATAIGLLITTVTFLLKLISAIKSKALSENKFKVSEELIELIEQAEKLTGYSGIQKKEYVISKANLYAKEHEIVPDALMLEQKLEELITLTKRVNIRDNGLHGIQSADIHGNLSLDVRGNSNIDTDVLTQDKTYENPSITLLEMPHGR